MWSFVVAFAILLAVAIAEESACGSSSVSFSTYLAGMVAGKHLPSFESCCAAHDSCYDSCTSRDQCDMDFGECMRTTCAKRNPSATIDYEDCVNTSGVFQTAVEAFGGYAYSENCTEELNPVQFMFDFLETNTAEIMELFAS